MAMDVGRILELIANLEAEIKVHQNGICSIKNKTRFMRLICGKKARIRLISCNFVGALAGI